MNTKYNFLKNQLDFINKKEYIIYFSVSHNFDNTVYFLSLTTTSTLISKGLTRI